MYSEMQSENRVRGKSDTNTPEVDSDGFAFNDYKFNPVDPSGYHNYSRHHSELYDPELQGHYSDRFDVDSVD